LPAGLYVVATPIGNAADVTLRALRVLAAADAIACEDTRVTARLLAVHAIARPLVAYHEHNEAAMAPLLLERVAAGEVIALVSDAGTPLVSDPGHRLVQGAIARGLAVVPIPGASALLAALAVSGLPTHRFLFEGFLPPKAGPRRRALVLLRECPATLVFFESPHRLAASLADMLESLGDRPAVVARELTKLYEEHRRGQLSELAASYAEATPPRGEITIVVAPPAAATTATRAADEDARIDAGLRAALVEASPSEAAAQVAAATGLPRRRVYARALALAGRR
jgi:16S rRNA (cytidine1402-2'-O)-methyltransferase